MFYLALILVTILVGSSECLVQCLTFENYSCSCKDLMVDCTSKNITDFPNDVIVPKNSETINLSRNNIRLLSRICGIWFSREEALRTLDVGHNKISLIEDRVFEGLFNLDTLILTNNNLTFIQSNAFEGLNGLQTLDLSYNHLTFIDSMWFTQTGHLMRLDLSYNPIGDGTIPNYAPFFQHCHNLQYLDLANCHFKNLPLDMFNGTKITELRLSKNPLTIIPITPLYGIRKSLRMLDLTEICISEVNNHAFHGLKELRILYLNQLPFLTGIEALAFNDLRKLDVIEIRKNSQLREIHPMAFYNTLEDSRPNVIWNVFMDGNKLTTVSQGLLRWEEAEAIEMGDNPWFCNCQMAWLLDLKKKNSSKILFDDYLRCHLPENLKGIPMVHLSGRTIGCSWKLSQNHTTAVGLGLMMTVSIMIFAAFMVLSTKQCRNTRLKNKTIAGLFGRQPENIDKDTVGYRRLQLQDSGRVQITAKTTSGDSFEWDPPLEPKESKVT